MEDLNASFGFYRSCFDNNNRRQGLETEGIFDVDDFIRIVQDPDTVNLKLDGVSLPLLTPIDRRANWFNLEFYESLADNESDFVYYSHLGNVFKSHPDIYSQSLAAALQSLAAKKGALAFEHSGFEAARVESEVVTLLDNLSLDYSDLTAQEGVDAKHYQYVSGTGLIDPKEPDGFSNFYTAYEQALKGGLFDPQGSVTLTDRLSDEEIQYVWGFYEDVNLDLSVPDPAHAGFSQDELTEVMQANEFIKLVNKLGGTIVNLCVIVDIRHCPWMNQYYYRSNFPEHYQSGRIICGVGLLTNPNVEHQLAPSLQTLGVVGKLICQSQVEHTFTFACNVTSNRHVPTLTERSLNRAGLQVDFSEPAGHQIFRALQLSPK